MTIFDVNGKSTTLPFDLVQGSSPLIVVIDIEKYGNTQNMKAQKYFKFKRPHDNSSQKFHTYIAKDASGDERIWLDIVPHTNSYIKSLMANIVKRLEINIVKKVHRFTHCNAKELQTLFEEAGLLTPKLEKAIEKVTVACTPCASRGRPSQTRKISLKHVNE